VAISILSTCRTEPKGTAIGKQMATKTLGDQTFCTIHNRTYFRVPKCPLNSVAMLTNQNTYIEVNSRKVSRACWYSDTSTNKQTICYHGRCRTFNSSCLHHAQWGGTAYGGQISKEYIREDILSVMVGF
jgi:hypothetical protein